MEKPVGRILGSVRKDDGTYELLHEKRGAKPKRYVVPLNIRITKDMMDGLEEISKFERHMSIAEIVRGWINDRIGTYSRNPMFKRFTRVEAQERTRLEMLKGKMPVEGQEE